MTEMLHEQENNYSVEQNTSRNENLNGDKLETESYSHKSTVSKKNISYKYSHSHLS